VEATDVGAFTNIAGLVATPNDGLWFSNGVGIVHLPESEVAFALRDASHKARFEIFDLVSDLPGSTQNFMLHHASAAMGSDGILWFATLNGVARIDPARVFRNPLPPPVSIRSIVADGRTYPVSPGLVLPPFTRDSAIILPGYY
jgi:hypothetical protein